MAKVIAFSGGCFSGKTTTIYAIAEELEKKGYNVKIISELMREITHLSIDELRKNPAEYLKIQEQIITKKIDQECMAFNDKSDTLYLIDRAITDSLFYLENYVDKSNLTEIEITNLCNLDSEVRKHALHAFNNGYDMLIEFEPLDITEDPKDKYRPTYLNSLKSYEYNGISTLNAAYTSLAYVFNVFGFFLKVNMKNISVKDIINTIHCNLYV